MLKAVTMIKALKLLFFILALSLVYFSAIFDRWILIGEFQKDILLVIFSGFFLGVILRVPWFDIRGWQVVLICFPIPVISLAYERGLLQLVTAANAMVTGPPARDDILENHYALLVIDIPFMLLIGAIFSMNAFAGFCFGRQIEMAISRLELGSKNAPSYEVLAQLFVGATGAIATIFAAAI